MTALVEYGTRGLTGDATRRPLSQALDVITESPTYQLVRRVNRGPWEPCPVESVTPAVTPPTTAEYRALVSLVNRRVHDLMRVDWKAGLADLNCTWLPFYGNYCWESPMGEPGAFSIRRLKELALSVPIGSGWEALTPVDAQAEQLELFEVAA